MTKDNWKLKIMSLLPNSISFFNCSISKVISFFFSVCIFPIDSIDVFPDGDQILLQLQQNDDKILFVLFV